MDLAALKDGLTLVGTALGIARQAKDLLPASSEKEKVEVALDQAEHQLKLAQAQVAKGLGYQLCMAHFPPETMLSEDTIHWRCPVCGGERYTGPPRAVSRVRRR